MTNVDDLKYRNKLIQHARCEHCKHEDNWLDVSRSKFLQWFYTFKCIVCVYLDWEMSAATKHYDVDYVVVAYFDWQPTYDFEFGAGAAGDMLCVLRNEWKYFVMSDGYP
jgi:hypothetical protein